MSQIKAYIMMIISPQSLVQCIRSPYCQWSDLMFYINRLVRIIKRSIIVDWIWSTSVDCGGYFVVLVWHKEVLLCSHCSLCALATSYLHKEPCLTMTKFPSDSRSYVFVSCVSVVPQFLGDSVVGKWAWVRELGVAGTVLVSLTTGALCKVTHRTSSLWATETPVAL